MEGTRVCWPEPGRAVVEPFEVTGPGRGELLVETETTLLSPGTERAFFLGLPNTSERFPAYPGYCAVGRVAAVGEGVDGFEPGDRVAAGSPHASHARVRAARCAKLPAGIAAERAVYHSLAAIALQGVRRARIELGEAVLVLGLGLVGNLALQVARLQGALPAVGVDLDAGRRAAAAECGADACADPAGAPELLRERLPAGAPAVVIEATGFPEAVNDALAYAGEHGRVVLLASTRGVTETNFYRDVHRKGLAVYGAHNGARPRAESSPGFWTLGDDTAVALRLLAAGRLRVEPLTTAALPAGEAPRAYEWLASWRRDLLGVILRWAA